MSVVVRPEAKPYVSLRNPENLEGLRGLALWSFANLALPLINSMLPTYSQINGQALKLYVASLSLNLIFTLLKVAVPLRIPAAIGGLIVLNFWLVVCDFNAAITMGRMLPLEPTDYFFLLYILWFLQAAALAFYAPWVRPIYLRLILGVVFINAVMSLLQFAHFGPALAIANIYSRLNDITNWNNLGGTRVVGLTGWPETVTLWMITGAAYTMSPLLYTKLKPTHVVLTAMFILVGLLAQLRSLYPILFAEAALFLYLLVKRNRDATVAYLSLASLISLVVGAIYLPVIAEKLKYGFSLNSNSAVFRFTVGWQQAFNILAKRPIYGIGHEPNFVSLILPITTRWGAAMGLDCGYLDLGAWGGYPAMAIFIVTGYLALRAIIKNFKKTRHDPLMYRLNFVVLVQASAILFSMLFNPCFFTAYFIHTVFVTGGLLMASERSYIQEKFRIAY